VAECADPCFEFNDHPERLDHGPKAALMATSVNQKMGEAILSSLQSSLIFLNRRLTLMIPYDVIAM
jgi:hypothetical protein